MLYKYVSVYIKYLHYMHVIQAARTQVQPGGHSPSKFLEYLVILCFKS